MKLIAHAKHNQVQYELKEKNWTAEIWQGGRVRVTNGVVIDYPIQYPHNGSIAYDRPEDIPEYAKRLVVKAFRLINKLNN